MGRWASAVRLSVVTKIFLGFAVVIVAFGASQAFTLYRMSALRRTVTVLWRELTPMANQLRTLSRQLRSTEEFLAFNRPGDLVWLGKVLPTFDPFDGARGFSRFAEQLERLGREEEVGSDGQELLELAGKLRALVGGGSLREALGAEVPPEVVRPGEVVGNAELYQRLIKRTIMVAELGTLTAESRETKSLARVFRMLNREVNDASRALAVPIHRIERAVVDDERSTTMAVGFVAAGALAVSLVMLWVAQWTLRPIRGLRRGAERIAAGDYAGRVVVPSADELGQLAEEFNRMAGSLEERDRALVRKQGELVRAERLAAVGRLAAQITHEVRNPLSSIGLNAELLEDELAELPEPAEAQAMLESIAREVDRLKKITEQYLQLARHSGGEGGRSEGGGELGGRGGELGGSPGEEVVATVQAAEGGKEAGMRPWIGLGAVCVRLAGFLEREAQELGVRLTVEGVTAGEQAVQARVDAEQLWQALLNIVRNAFEALAGVDGARWVRFRVGEAGGEAWVAVRNNGPAIAEELQARLFRPFATGKAHGTGLGLVVTRDIVVANGGRIEVVSPLDGEDSGAEFLLRFPIVDKKL